MRPEHRHELKTNELAEWLINLPQWAKDNLRTIIYVGVVIVLVAGAYIWKVYQKNVVDLNLKSNFTNFLSLIAASKQEVIAYQAAGQDSSFRLIQLSNELQRIAEKSKNDNTTALALIKSAEAIRAELHYRQLLAITPEDIVTQINKAKADYNAALQKSPANPSLRAMARYGIGLCEEELENFDAAKNIYQEIINDPNLQSTVAVAQAKARLQYMDDFKEKITFMPAPVKEEPFKPSIELKPTIDINQVKLDINSVKQPSPNIPAVIESIDTNKVPGQ